MENKKQLRVFLYAEENDSFVELWKILGDEDGFIGRFTYSGEWCYVADPLGYCELDSAIPNEVEIIVCAPNGDELFCTRNGDGSSLFRTPAKESKARWSQYAKKAGISVISYDDFREWLLSFQDPEQYEVAKDYPENWTFYHISKIKADVLESYSYLGYVTEFTRNHFKHNICGVEWDEYRAGGLLLGYNFDKEACGPMYSPGTARSLVMDAIKTHHGNASAVSYVQSCCVGYAQRNVRLWQAADILLGGNYNKVFVKSVVGEEARSSRFYTQGWRGITEIRKKYPNCIADHEFII